MLLASDSYVCLVVGKVAKEVRFEEKRLTLFPVAKIKVKAGQSYFGKH